MNYKLVLYSLAAGTDPKKLADEIVESYGEDFDAKLGDFTAYAVLNEVEVIVKDVAKGDVRTLREDIYRDFGDEDDSMMVRVSEHRPELGSWFSIELEED